MLTTPEIKAHLERITYKPGWAITAYDGRFEGQHITIRLEQPDSTNPETMVTLQVESMLPPMRDTQHLEDWLIWRIGRIEVHEAREFLKLDGRVLFDPHAPYADRDQPTHTPTSFDAAPENYLIQAHRRFANKR